MKRKLIDVFLIILSLFIGITEVKADDLDNISSKNVILINLNDDKVIYEKNADEKVNIASLTKIMTTIVAIENIDNLNREVIISRDIINNLSYDLSIVGFEIGEVVTYYDLLYGTLLKSGADATDTLAVNISGSISDFVKLMNDKAKEIGMNNTSFSNTIGIEGENHYSTARDISILLNYALNNDTFRKIFTTEHYVSSNNKHDMYGPLKYIKEYDMPYVKGAKTGYTKIAGLCLASIATYNNTNYLLVTIGADYENKKQHFSDQKQIYEYIFNNYEYKKIISQNEKILTLKTIYDEEYYINSMKDVKIYLNKNIEKEDLIYEYDGIELLDKKIKKGDSLGKYYIKYGDDILYSINVLSPVTVHMTLQYFIKNNIVVIGLIILIIILTILTLNKKRNNYK